MKSSIPTSQERRNGQLFWFVLAMGFAYGVVFNFLPVTFPVLRRAFETTPEQLGRTQLAFFLGGIGVSLGGGWLIARVGAQRVSVSSIVCLLVGLLMVGSASIFAMVVIGAFCSGLAILSLIVVSNIIISENFEEQRQSTFFVWGVSDAIGAVLGPTLLGWWLGHAGRTGGNWRWGYFTTCGLLLLMAVWGLVLSKKKSPAEYVNEMKDDGGIAVMKVLLADPTLYLVGLAMFLHGLAQMGMVSWVGQLYHTKLGIDAGKAAYLISVNSAGYFVGRALLGWITKRWNIPELLVLGGCAAMASLAFIATLASASYFSGLIMFGLAGMFVSGDTPSLSSYAGRRFIGCTATAFSLLGGIGNVGSGVGPYLIGLIGNKLGMQLGVWLMPVFGLGLAALAFGWFSRERLATRIRRKSR